MILRFRTIDKDGTPYYIAFNSALGTYTMNPEEVKRGNVIDILLGGMMHIKGELEFNCYSYTHDLHKSADVEIRDEVLIPLF